MNESELETKCVTYWEALGFRVPKLTNPGERGWSDRLVLGAWPVIGFAELKRDATQSLATAQSDIRDDLVGRGFDFQKIASLVDAYDFADELIAIGEQAAWAWDHWNTEEDVIHPGTAAKIEILNTWLEGAREGQRRAGRR